jgi:hypothetical protein
MQADRSTSKTSAIERAQLNQIIKDLFVSIRGFYNLRKNRAEPYLANEKQEAKIEHPVYEHAIIDT